MRKSYAGTTIPCLGMCAKKVKWVTRSDVWVEIPSIRALLEAMRDKIAGSKSYNKNNRRVCEAFWSAEIVR